MGPLSGRLPTRAKAIPIAWWHMRFSVTWKFYSGWLSRPFVPDPVRIYIHGVNSSGRKPLGCGAVAAPVARLGLCWLAAHEPAHR
jgi:hypothetical protein